VSDKENFDMVREIIRHEDNLVNNRVTWLLVLQGFLFAAFVNGLGLLDKLPGPFRLRAIGGLLLIGLLGIVTSLVARNTISTAYDHIEKVTSWWEKLIKDSIQNYPPVRGSYPSNWFYKLFSTSKMPYAFVAAWLALTGLLFWQW
jgi:hypothetical protein